MSEFVGREAELERLLGLLQQQVRYVVLEGHGGIGKTRLVVEAAERDRRGFEWFFVPAEMPIEFRSLDELGAANDVCVVLDDAHRRPGLDRDISVLASAEVAPQVILVSRPGYVEKVLESLPLSVGAGVEVLRVGPMKRAVIDRLLQGEPFAIESEGIRTVIIQLAEGNPQIALFAAELTQQGVPLSGLSRQEVFARYASNVLAAATGDSRVRRELLALIVALGGLSLDEAAARVAADILGI